MEATHILIAYYLSYKPSYSKQKNNIIIDFVEIPFPVALGRGRNGTRERSTSMVQSIV